MSEEPVLFSDQWANKYPLKAFLVALTVGVVFGFVFSFLVKVG